MRWEPPPCCPRKALWAQLHEIPQAWMYSGGPKWARGWRIEAVYSQSSTRSCDGFKFASILFGKGTVSLRGSEKGESRSCFLNALIWSQTLIRIGMSLDRRRLLQYNEELGAGGELWWGTELNWKGKQWHTAHPIPLPHMCCRAGRLVASQKR